MTNQKNIPFRARARTIDHLGKGQIADCPTAVSELWKNSYDAYAREVLLHMFDGDLKTAVLADNGCGMTRSQLISSWLVVGTESKSQKKKLPDVDMFGLKERKTQGEKGIGRLSTAFLAPVTLLVSKKVGAQYCAALIDWRLFENTYLALEDISVPIEEFNDINEVGSIAERLAHALKSNLDSRRSDLDPSFDPWERFSSDELALAESRGQEIITTRAKIESFCDTFLFRTSMLNSWRSVLASAKELDGEEHGTALFLFDLERDLALLTNPGELASDNDEVGTIKGDLVDTLRAFVNPFEQEEHRFHYEIKAFSKHGLEKDILRPADNFDLQNFLSLEHVVRGVVDERGWFSGTVKAFGKDVGPVKFAPSIELDAGFSKVGPFEINIGTYEYEQDKSSLSPQQLALVKEQAKRYSGLMVFRDDLRVLPYGRVDNDFFEIEERRSINAGRYYWSKRRIFGQILITQDRNSALRDKAGREGFIKNQAARELKNLVSSVLNDLATRYFGSDSAARKELLDIVKKERQARKEAQTQARKVTQKAFLEELKAKEPLLAVDFSSAKTIHEKLTRGISNIDELEALEGEMARLEARRGELKTPTQPARLGDHEQRYREYRDTYNEFSAYLLESRQGLNKVQSELNKRSAVQVAKRTLERNQGLLNSQVGKALSQIEKRLALLSTNWSNEANGDRSLYHARAIDILESVKEESNLNNVLNSLDAIYADLADTFTLKYDALLKALDRMTKGVDLDSAFSMAEEERMHFEDKAKSMNALAQLGISVEILAHELDALDALVTKGMSSLPSEAKKHPGFSMAYNAHRALTHQIRFLSPLKLSGYQLRQTITGRDIEQHIRTFFGDRFERQRVDIGFSEIFRRIHIKDLPSRIFPVFVNLMNNALYWVRLAETREIKLDVRGGEVFFSNSGPPVDIDDASRLFELFYSRRPNGNGVGLYLCKENLAVARHKIRYETDEQHQLIVGGANFVIQFNGMEIGE